MECVEYIRDFLSAHADGELSSAELRAADDHVAQCSKCRRMLDEEQQLKLLIRSSGTETVSDSARARLTREIDADEEAQPAISSQPHGRQRAGFTPPRVVWVPLAIAASVIIGILLINRRSGIEFARSYLGLAHNESYSTFDAAVAAFDRMRSNFEPNVPSSSPAEIAAAYRDAGMPDHLWNFTRAGMALQGGRMGILPSGQHATYTLYRGSGGAIMCIFISAPELTTPPDGTRTLVSIPVPPGSAPSTVSRTFYKYKGHSICYTEIPGTRCVCLLISDQSVERLEHYVVLGSS